MNPAGGFWTWLGARAGISPPGIPNAPWPLVGMEDAVAPDSPIGRPWTLLVYMAGDNGKVFNTSSGPRRLMAEMTTAGYRDIWEMAQVGTTDRCAVLCLFDTVDGSFLVEVRRGRGMADSEVQTLRELNTGDPAVLRDFVLYGMERFPAEHYALVIWNHGTGWLDVDGYATVRSQELDYKPHGAIFRTTLRKLQGDDATRPIAFDDTSKDFLDTQDLRQAFAEVQAATGRQLDLIGMDACLMAMIEGASELAPYARVFVASQEVEPMDGWPYALILEGLNVQPACDPAELAVRIVEEYAVAHNANTRVSETITQSAVDLAVGGAVEALVKGLVDAVLAHREDETLRTAVSRARDDSLKFQDRNYRDLGDFARLLASDLDLAFYDGLREAAGQLSRLLHERAPGKPVLKAAFRPNYERATGLSVYLPGISGTPSQRRKALDVYRPLLFAQATGWDMLIAWLDRELNEF